MTLTTESGLDGEYVPSPTEGVRTQVADYEASGGVKGGTLEGRPVVIDRNGGRVGHSICHIAGRGVSVRQLY
jgi:hypothetical protein